MFEHSVIPPTICASALSAFTPVRLVGLLVECCGSTAIASVPYSGTYCFAAPTTRSLPPKAVRLKPESAHYIVTDYFVSPQEWNT